MTDLLSIGASALLANQAGLASVGQNIANANNENYTRQEVVFCSLGSQQALSGFSGQGVLAQGARRLYDGYLANQLRYSTSQFNAAQSLSGYSSDLANFLSDRNTGLSDQIQNLFNAFQDGGNNPSSETVRSSILSAANNLKDRFSSVNQHVLDQYKSLNGSISTLSSQVNNLTAQLATINAQLQKVGVTNEFSQPNETLDARDKIVLQLSGLLGAKVVTEDNGVANVYLASGEGLIIGDKAESFYSVNNSSDLNRPDLALNNSIVTGRITGGFLGGLLTYRDEQLKKFDDSFDALASALVTSVNAQHANGMTLTNSLGGDFFKLSTDSSIDLFKVAVTNTDDIALAQPAFAFAATANTGTGTISQPVIWSASDDFFDSATKSIKPPILIIVTSAKTYDVLDNTNPKNPVVLLSNQTFKQGIDNTLFSASTSDSGLKTGYQVIINGTPKIGDQFYIAYNTDGFLDNRNAVSLSNIGSSILSSYNDLVFTINDSANTALSSQASADTLLNKAKNDHQSLSGVNLDEEAVQLTKYQQTFNASAKLIEVSRTMIDYLLNIL